MNNDAVSIAPHMHKIMFENDRVRVLEVEVAPGVSAEMHTHPDNVIVVLESGTMEMTNRDQEPQIVELEKGKALFMGALEHSAINVGKTTAKFIQVEIK